MTRPAVVHAVRVGSAVITLAAAMVACDAATEPTPDGEQQPNSVPSGIALVEVVRGLDSPIFVTSPRTDSRLFIVEQGGRVRILHDGQLAAAPFLDISDIVLSGGERGLLSMAFPPDYSTSGVFYVSYTDQDGDSRIARYFVSTDPNVADRSTAKVILSVAQPFSNHNGGLIAFGPDGMLYVGLGDGGSGGDPLNSGQDVGTLLGAILRLDVNGGDPYAIPADNPFVSDPAARDEIWAYGLRNPWRFAFDDEADVLYVADVGQNDWEEVSGVPASASGLNFGWRIMEGDHCFNASSCDRADLVRPVVEYDHDQGCSVTGGYVYRGSAIAGLRGHYLYSDFCSGWLRSFVLAGGQATEQTDWNVGRIGNVVSFGEDGANELYVVVQDGRVLRLAPAG